MNELPQRAPRQASKTSFVLSVLLHVVLGLVIFFVAAREGLFGKKLREITAVVVPEEKKPEKKPEEPKKEEVVKNEPKPSETPKPAPAPVANTAPPPATAAPVAAPPPAIGADFAFSDGAKAVVSTSDPQELYKAAVEYAFRSRWTKPEDVDDTAYVAEAEVRLAPDGKVLGTELKRGSGDRKWDATVLAALKATPEVGRRPPQGFPERFVVRFDAVAEESVGGVP